MIEELLARPQGGEPASVHDFAKRAVNRDAAEMQYDQKFAQLIGLN